MDMTDDREKLFCATLADGDTGMGIVVDSDDEVADWLHHHKTGWSTSESVMFGEPFEIGVAFELHKVDRDIRFLDDADGLSIGISIWEYEQDEKQGYMFCCNSGTIGANCDPFYAFTPRTDEAIGRTIAWFIHSFYGDWSKSLDTGIPLPNAT